MGLDLTLFMADWERLSAIPVENRVQALDDTTWSPELDDEYLRYGPAGGWLWGVFPPSTGRGLPHPPLRTATSRRSVSPRGEEEMNDSLASLRVLPRGGRHRGEQAPRRAGFSGAGHPWGC